MTSNPFSARAYVVISPCRNEADYMRRTLDSVVGQSCRPTAWVIVNDGSTDDTQKILEDYAARHDWIKVVAKPDRGKRAVGPGVIEAFYFGLKTVDLQPFTYLCKLDLDLDLPPRYFETLIERMEAEPRLGTCSGKPYIRRGDTLVSERRGDEMSVGMTKFYRRTCFEAIGGFVPEVMWDAIDCHKARQLGWLAASWDHPDLNFEHLRPMGSSQSSIYTGKRRHGFGQYYMGSDPVYFAATCVFRMAEPPYVLGGLAMMQGFLGAWLRREARHGDTELRNFIRAWQRRALRVGKSQATAEFEAARADLFLDSPA
ncbi:glycosyltransferase family 2 protein [Tropicimonas sp. S265A]|uniref:glycosyltransferase family 2 protein n=1 Tax=Tropicimonas sp. S265A TaxID=3415134 RepID=UPI003C7B1B39